MEVRQAHGAVLLAGLGLDGFLEIGAGLLQTAAGDRVVGCGVEEPQAPAPQAVAWPGGPVGVEVAREQVPRPERQGGGDVARAVAARSQRPGRGVLEGDGVDPGVPQPEPSVLPPDDVTAAPPEAERGIAVVSPCGACRELLVDYDPEALVIAPAVDGTLLKLPSRLLLPLPYRR